MGERVALAGQAAPAPATTGVRIRCAVAHWPRPAVQRVPASPAWGCGPLRPPASIGSAVAFARPMAHADLARILDEAASQTCGRSLAHGRRARACLALLVGVSLAIPLEARAQCGASTSECRNCHEVRGAKSVLAAPAPWHSDHAFGDFCAICHGGDPQSKDEATAHVGLLSPLSDAQATCGSCHGADSESLARSYAVAVAAPAPPAASPTPAVAGRPAVAWRNVGLTSVVLVLGGVGAFYIVTNERRLRGGGPASKGDG